MSGKIEYRRIRFHQTNKGYWIFDDYLPDVALRWGYWSRFCEQGEATEASMKRAIDRAYRDEPLWRGDIRKQPRS